MSGDRLDSTGGRSSRETTYFLVKSHTSTTTVSEKSDWTPQVVDPRETTYFLVKSHTSTTTVSEMSGIENDVSGCDCDRTTREASCKPLDLLCRGGLGSGSIESQSYVGIGTIESLVWKLKLLITGG